MLPDKSNNLFWVLNVSNTYIPHNVKAQIMKHKYELFMKDKIWNTVSMGLKSKLKFRMIRHIMQAIWM